jgi:hypothetical protein
MLKLDYYGIYDFLFKDFLFLYQLFFGQLLHSFMEAAVLDLALGFIFLLVS